MNTVITKKEVPSNFNRVARWYDTLQKMNRGYSEHLRLSAERLGVKPGASLLDLCCGTGLSTEALRVVVRGIRTAKMMHLTEIMGFHPPPGLMISLANKPNQKLMETVNCILIIIKGGLLGVR